MIKGKTLLQILTCLIITLLISNNSYARLIKPEPKPSEYRKDIPAKVKKPSRKVTPAVLTPKKPMACDIIRPSACGDCNANRGKSDGHNHGMASSRSCQNTKTMPSF